MISLSMPYGNPSSFSLSLPFALLSLLLLLLCPIVPSSSCNSDFDTTLTAAFWPVDWCVAKSTLPVAPLPNVLPNFQGPIFCGWLWLEIDATDDPIETSLECDIVFKIGS